MEDDTVDLWRNSTKEKHDSSHKLQDTRKNNSGTHKSNEINKHKQDNQSNKVQENHHTNTNNDHESGGARFPSEASNSQRDVKKRVGGTREL